MIHTGEKRRLGATVAVVADVSMYFSGWVSVAVIPGLPINLPEDPGVEQAGRDDGKNHY